MDDQKIDQLMRLAQNVREAVAKFRPELLKKLDLKEIESAIAEQLSEADRRLGFFSLPPISDGYAGINLDSLEQLARDHKLNPDAMSAAEIFELVIELQKSARVNMIAARLNEPTAKAPKRISLNEITESFEFENGNGLKRDAIDKRLKAGRVIEIELGTKVYDFCEVAKALSNGPKPMKFNAAKFYKN